MDIRWAHSKSNELRRLRGLSFEEIIQMDLIAIKENPTRSNQRIWKAGELT